MEYLATGYDSRVYKDGDDCVKFYKTDYRKLSGEILYDYHYIQNLMSSAIDGIIRGNVGDIPGEYFGFDFSLEILPLPQTSISSEYGIYSSRLPFIEGPTLEEINFGEVIIPALLDVVKLPYNLSSPLRGALSNVKIQKVGNKVGKLIITDLGAQIQGFCRSFNTYRRSEVEEFLFDSD